MTILAPNKKLSTSSDKIASMTPVLFRWASSASASPGAFKGHRKRFDQKGTENDQRRTHHPPLEAERFDDTLHAVDQPVLFPGDFLPALELGALGPVEDEDGEKRGTREPCTTKEQSSQFRVLALSPVRGMKEPNGCIDANAQASKVGRIALETVHNGDVGEGSQFPRGSEDL
jgi:hypothetical protein